MGTNKNGNGNHEITASSASRIMTTKIPTINLTSSVREVEMLLEKQMKDFETINYVYVVDGRDRKLRGVLSIKDIFRQPKEKLVKDIMKTELVTVRPHTHQERVAYLALKNNVKAIPVVDKDDNLLGVVSNEAITSIVHSEATEDFMKIAGIHRSKVGIDNIFDLSVFRSFEHRFPWLFIGLLGGVFMAKIISGFEDTLEKNIILASFIPLIVYMADAVGTQMEAFIIRDLAVMPNFNFLSYFLKHLKVVFLIAILSSLALFALNLILYGNMMVGVVLGIALFVAILSSFFTGLVIPYSLGKFKFDPANASGPIATIIQDTLSVVIYFAVASWLL
jgi:magnesium transporter